MKVKNSLYFKTCPWCRGDLYMDKDCYGVFATCLQCGRIFESHNPLPSLVEAGADSDSRRVAA